MNLKKLLFGFGLALMLATQVMHAQQSSVESKRVADLRTKAQKGIADAQFSLGFRYFHGQGVAKDYAEAVKWYSKAAEQGHAKAQSDLGFCYFAGQGVAKDKVEAYKWWRLASSHGERRAKESMITLEDVMTPNETVEGDKRVNVWVEQHSHKPRPAPQIVSKSVSQPSVAPPMMAAEATDASDADRIIGLRTKAETGDAKAQYELGVSFYQGRFGVARDEGLAMKWFRKAAEQNLAEAQFYLACCYAHSLLEEEQVEAVKWFRKAAEQNLCEAQFNLGRRYAKGKGTEKKISEAVKWYRKAAEQNVGEAKFYLGGCYVRGEGVERDIVEGYKWYLLAGMGVPTLLKINMSPEQVAEGKGRAKDWLQKHKLNPKFIAYVLTRDSREILAEVVDGFVGLNSLTRHGLESRDVAATPIANPDPNSGWATSTLDDARKEAQGGNSEAQWYLGHCYSTGQRVEKDLTAAASWFHKAADRGNKFGQFGIAVCYYNGQGVEKNDDEALKWFILAGENGHADAAYLAGSLTEQKGDIETARYYYLKALENGHPKAQGAFQGAASDASSKWSEDFVKTKAQSGDVDAQWDLAYHYYKANSLDAAVFWFRKAAENGHSYAQYYLGTCYYAGRGLEKNIDEAIKWYALAANNGEPNAAFSMGALAERVGDIELAKSWYNLAVRNGHPTAAARLQTITTRTVEKEKPPNDVKPHRQPTPENSRSAGEIAQTRPVAFGTGFFITEDGYLVTNEHVVGNTTRVELFTAVGTVSAKVVKVDVANDLALLKAEGRFALLPIVASRAMRLGGTVATVGFPNIGLQGISPKLTKGEITSLAGAKDDPRYFQISVPVQPGNSGGALVDEHGNVVGVVAAKLDARAALDASGALPENVNYAVKSSLLLNFLESLPEVTAKLKEPETKERKFEDVVESTKQTAVLLVVY